MWKLSRKEKNEMEIDVNCPSCSKKLRIEFTSFTFQVKSVRKNAAKRQSATVYNEQSDYVDEEITCPVCGETNECMFTVTAQMMQNGYESWEKKK